MAKTTAMDVAQHVYDRYGWVDAWKLEKLVYYTQAWHLAWDGRPLFEQEFEAWPDGPVSRDLHRENKYGRKHTLDPVLPDADSSALTSHERQIVDAVLDFYGGLSTQELIDLTHKDSPWVVARGNLPPKAPSSIKLSVAEMRRCYTAKAVSGQADVPKAPSDAAVGVSSGNYGNAISHQLARWSGALTLLADR